MNAFWASETFNAFIRSEPPNYEILARKLYPKMVQFSGSRLLLAQALERPAAGQVQNVSLGHKRRIWHVRGLVRSSSDSRQSGHRCRSLPAISRMITSFIIRERGHLGSGAGECRFTPPSMQQRPVESHHLRPLRSLGGQLRHSRPWRERRQRRDPIDRRHEGAGKVASFPWRAL